MPVIILPSRQHRQQPAISTQADLTSPLCAGITGLFNLQSLSVKNLLTNKPVSFLSVTGSPNIFTKSGFGLYGNIFGGSNTFVTATLESTTTELITSTDATFVWTGSILDLTYGGVMCRGDDSNGNGSSLRLKVTASGEAEFSYVDTSPAAFTATTSGAGIIAGEIVTLVGVKKGKTVAVYCKGKSATNSGGNGNLRTSGRGVSLNYTGNSGNTASGGAAYHLLAATFKTGKNPREAKSLSENPWQLFKAPQRRFWIDQIGGGDSVISVDGSTTGISSAGASALSIFQAAGFSTGTATLSSQVNAIYQSNGLSSGAASVNAVINAICNSIGSGAGYSTADATSNTVWVVVGNSQGIGTANGSTTATTVSSVEGNSTGSSATTAIASAIVTATGGVISSSVGNASAIAIQISVGNSSGTSSIDAIVQTIKGVVANAVGSCNVQGVSDDDTPAEEFIPITGNVSVTIITAQYGVQNLTSVFGASLL